MEIFLITWNPKEFQWETLNEDINSIKEKGEFIGTWSCGGTKRIKPGDRIFMLRQGIEPRGIFASGWAISSVYQDIHWYDDSKTANYIDIQFDVILNPELDRIIPRKALDESKFSGMYWDPHSSGTSIPPSIAEKLELEWSILNNLVTSSFNEDFPIDGFNEGARTQSVVIRYERNRAARRVCLNHYGTNCSVCNFSFHNFYGELGSDYIHVHHVNEISLTAGPYILNPIEDLRPVCPNCHAMLHRSKPALSIQELKGIILNRK